MQIIKYKITTPEEDDFLLEIEIPCEKTFLDLNNAILQIVGYDTKMNYTFFLSDEKWDYRDEIIFECWDEKTQSELLLMKDTLLTHFDPIKGQRYLYVFDDINQRGFFIEIGRVRNLRKSEKEEDFVKYSLKGKIPKQLELDQNIEQIDENEMLEEFDDLLEDDLFEDINLAEDEYGAYSDSYDDDF